MSEVEISPKFHAKNGAKDGKFHTKFTLLGRGAEKIRAIGEPATKTTTTLGTSTLSSHCQPGLSTSTTAPGFSRTRLPELLGLVPGRGSRKQRQKGLA